MSLGQVGFVDVELMKTAEFPSTGTEGVHEHNDSVSVQGLHSIGGMVAGLLCFIRVLAVGSRSFVFQG